MSKTKRKYKPKREPKREYEFWIESPGELLNENFTALLNMAGYSADTTAEVIEVAGVGEVYAYRVPKHALITFISKSENASAFRVFVREGGGKIRQYHNYHKKLKEEARLKRQKDLLNTIKRASQLNKR